MAYNYTAVEALLYTVRGFLKHAAQCPDVTASDVERLLGIAWDDFITGIGAAILIDKGKLEESAITHFSIQQLTQLIHDVEERAGTRILNIGKPDSSEMIMILRQLAGQ